MPKDNSPDAAPPSSIAPEIQKEHSCKRNHCPTCEDEDSDYIDPFPGETMDDHMDSDVSEEELGKRIADACEIAKRLGGTVPLGMEDELGTLTAPKLTLSDFLRMRIWKKKQGVGRKDWTSPKTRPLFAGLYVPKKLDYHVTILVDYDCSGSMSNDMVAKGVSQVQVLKDLATIYLLPWDTQPYYDAMIKIEKANLENLTRAKVKGKGGTLCNEVFKTYEKEIGKVDIIITITDGYLADTELRDIKPDPKVDYIWVIIGPNASFKPPFGRVFHLDE
jgi:predicted metal-dependent peptidase